MRDDSRRGFGGDNRTIITLGENAFISSGTAMRVVSTSHTQHTPHTAVFPLSRIAKSTFSSLLSLESVACAHTSPHFLSFALCLVCSRGLNVNNYPSRGLLNAFQQFTLCLIPLFFMAKSMKISWHFPTFFFFLSLFSLHSLTHSLSLSLRLSHRFLLHDYGSVRSVLLVVWHIQSTTITNERCAPPNRYFSASENIPQLPKSTLAAEQERICSSNRRSRPRDEFDTE